VAVTAGVAAVARSLLPDRHLHTALTLVNALQRASRDYGCIDWCAGIFLTRGGPVAAVTSNEGAGFIPFGVHLPAGVRLVFTDPAVTDGFRDRWFGWANPAGTMLAYADLVGNVELVALAVSVNDGGSAAPARHLPQYTETDLAAADDTPDDDDGEVRLHRLAVLDPMEYARVTTTEMAPNDGGLRTQTTAAVNGVLARAGMPVPPVIEEAVAALTARADLTAHQHEELADAEAAARFTAAAHRPGRFLDAPSPVYRAAHDITRAAELLGYWSAAPPAWPDIAYTARQLP